MKNTIELNGKRIKALKNRIKESEKEILIFNKIKRIDEKNKNLEYQDEILRLTGLCEDFRAEDKRVREVNKYLKNKYSDLQAKAIKLLEDYELLKAKETPAQGQFVPGF